MLPSLMSYGDYFTEAVQIVTVQDKITSQDRCRQVFKDAHNIQS